MESSLSDIGMMIRLLAASLVDRPEAILVREDERDECILVELVVARGDYGRLVGRRGRTLQAFRELSALWSHRRGKRYDIRIRSRALPSLGEEKGKGSRGEVFPFKVDRSGNRCAGDRGADSFVAFLRGRPGPRLNGSLCG